VDKRKKWYKKEMRNRTKINRKRFFDSERPGGGILLGVCVTENTFFAVILNCHTVTRHREKPSHGDDND
jgi:hypothetical protein